MKTEVLSQIDELIETGQLLTESFQECDDAFAASPYKSNASEAELRAFVISAFTTIEQIADKDSLYYKNTPHDSVPLQLAISDERLLFSTITGVLIALRYAVDHGLLASLESKLRANIHEDFLAQSLDLLNADYHVAAMVLIGGVIEDHLQKLVQIQGLTLPKQGSISKYNDLLRNDNVYNQPMWRRIQSIGDLRNDAAHGKGSTIKFEDVQDAHTFVKRFITDYPA
ncbi:MAG: hypothetical protein OXG87_10995 [Gemmatimonadetes bacterium]|nr:hypothetical protein [Gemmatimonadota bacterium]